MYVASVIGTEPPLLHALRSSQLVTARTRTEQENAQMCPRLRGLLQQLGHTQFEP